MYGNFCSKKLLIGLLYDPTKIRQRYLFKSDANKNLNKELF